MASILVRCLCVLTLTVSVVSAAEAAPAGDPSVLPAGAKLEQLWNDGEFTEGVAVSRDGLVYFSDIAIEARNPGRIMKYNPATGATSVHVADSGQSNGLFFDSSGRLLAACGANIGLRGLCEVTADGRMKVIVDKFEGKRFNSPNDLVIHPSGRVYFSDPRYVGKESLELDHMSVYRVDPDGSVHRATTQIRKPNGVILSPDAKSLYVAETDNGSTGLEPAGTPAKAPRMTLNAFPIQADGSLGTKRVLVDFGQGTGTDGMTTDTEGRIYCAVRKEERHGIVVFSPEGKEVAYVPTDPLPTNCTFGTGMDSKTLYVTAGTGLYRIKLSSTGYHPELK
ncbi:MAG: SMP-30/gluconolactonase/LRE family protein [Planctomycetes bacterium]|nr:SMP-30/gluconolactonase/LRE family protein [Planctomycetota bacterium]